MAQGTVVRVMPIKGAKAPAFVLRAIPVAVQVRRTMKFSLRFFGVSRVVSARVGRLALRRSGASLLGVLAG